MKSFFRIVALGALVALGSFAITGCNSHSATSDKMGADKMGAWRQNGRRQDGRRQDGRRQDGRRQDGRRQDGWRQDEIVNRCPLTRAANEETFDHEAA